MVPTPHPTPEYPLPSTSENKTPPIKIFPNLCKFSSVDQYSVSAVFDHLLSSYYVSSYLTYERSFHIYSSPDYLHSA